MRGDFEKCEPQKLLTISGHILLFDDWSNKGEDMSFSDDERLGLKD